MSVRSESFFSHKKNFLVKTNGIFNYFKDVPSIKCGKKIISNTKLTNFNNVSLNLNYEKSMNNRQHSTQNTVNIIKHNESTKNIKSNLIKIDRSADIQILRSNSPRIFENKSLEKAYSEDPQISFNISNKTRNADILSNLRGKEKIEMILKTENEALNKDRYMLKQTKSYTKMPEIETDQGMMKPRLILTKNLIKDFYNLTSSSVNTQDILRQPNFQTDKIFEVKIDEGVPQHRVLKPNNSASNVS